ncbi:beta-lactamase hydrolase domain-containing protein [Leptolyngbya sp. AN02str]|uniref:beta-lactamase hydrolase domain-containing protein n=1 Tax=Leptolyngbya sp. AN02str TaxID=3423363 RepID=UPI003D31AFB8
MDTIRKITNDLAIAGQITLDDVHQLTQENYQTVVNLRSPKETGFLAEEQLKLENLGLYYVNLPIQLKSLNFDALLWVTQQIFELPKPILIHCDNGIRSSMVALMQIAMKQGMKAEDAFQKVATLGLLQE